MRVGFLTACMGGRKFDEVVEWAGANGFDCLEVAAGHLDLGSLAKGSVSQVRDLLDENRVEMSSIAAYTNILDPDETRRKANIKLVKDACRVANKLGVGVVCTLAGMPLPGMNRPQTVASKVFVKSWKEVMSAAAESNVKIALENWFATLLQGLDTFEMVLDAVGNERLGFNYDPSHLYWQGCDYLGAVDQFKDRIFHTHAKDTEVKHHVLRQVGVLGGGWWRYVIPGLGEIDWGKYVGHLRRAGYNNVLSIEHEDSALGVEEGLIIGRNNLRAVACA
jgi:sugar phosphate isomerase/epimerase